MNKTTIVIISILTIIVLGILGMYYFLSPKDMVPVDNNNQSQSTSTPVGLEKPTLNEGDQVVIGKSVQGRDIVAYNYGKGDKRILFVGGIHGGYSWNTALLAYQTNKYFKENSDVIPNNIVVTIIPTLNPDGLYKAVGNTNGIFMKTDVSKSQTVLSDSRFNANNVDLSRNFDCDWQAKGVWQTKTVSGGSAPFSEPESLAIRNYVDTHKIDAVVVWYSSAGGVYASKCGNSDVLPETSLITDTYAQASGYKAYKSFDFYETTGDMVNWFAKKDIPAISVLLTTHTDTEWDKNKKGVDALLQYYQNK